MICEGRPGGVEVAPHQADIARLRRERPCPGARRCRKGHDRLNRTGGRGTSLPEGVLPTAPRWRSSWPDMAWTSKTPDREAGPVVPLLAGLPAGPDGPASPLFTPNGEGAPTVRPVQTRPALPLARNLQSLQRTAHAMPIPADPAQLLDIAITPAIEGVSD